MVHLNFVGQLANESPKISNKKPAENKNIVSTGFDCITDLNNGDCPLYLNFGGLQIFEYFGGVLVGGGTVGSTGHNNTGGLGCSHGGGKALSSGREGNVP